MGSNSSIIDYSLNDKQYTIGKTLKIPPGIQTNLIIFQKFLDIGEECMTNVLDFNDLRTVKIKTLWGQIAHSSTNPSLTRWLKSIHTYILLTGKYDLQVRGEKLHSYDICEAGIFCMSMCGVDESH